jgi:Xaa-Pro aminopeptidase
MRCCKENQKEPANINTYLRNNLTFSGLILSKGRNVQACTRETSGNSNQTMEMEEDQTHMIWDSFAMGNPAFSWSPQRQHGRGKPRGEWMRMIKEEAEIAGKAWRKVKAIAGETVYCYCFSEALCSEMA